MKKEILRLVKSTTQRKDSHKLRSAQLMAIELTKSDAIDAFAKLLKQLPIRVVRDVINLGNLEIDKYFQDNIE